ncbi:MAG TPA: hypothetical protein VMX35_14490 [Acidobacteriota bacterium]|nr:hypothetical protein [Acidobacteriota bacterium]
MPSNQNILIIKNVVAKAEKQLAHVRQYARGTEIPTINELRYTLHHLLCHLAEDDEEEWKKSHRHARRALFDAYDAEAQFLSTKFMAFEEQHIDLVIGEVVPTISDWRAAVGAYAEFSRDTDRDHREDYYEKLEPHLAAIRPIISQLQQASDDLNKKRRETLDRRTREIKMLRWTIIVAVITAFAIRTISSVASRLTRKPPVS